MAPKARRTERARREAAAAPVAVAPPRPRNRLVNVAYDPQRCAIAPPPPAPSIRGAGLPGLTVALALRLSPACRLHLSRPKTSGAADTDSPRRGPGLMRGTLRGVQSVLERASLSLLDLPGGEAPPALHSRRGTPGA